MRSPGTPVRAAGRVRRTARQVLLASLAATALLLAAQGLAVPATAAVVAGGTGAAPADLPTTSVPDPSGIVQCHTQGMFQTSDATCAALASLERRATGEVAVARNLPADQATVRAYARGDVIATMFASAIELAQQPAASRTAEDALVVTWLTRVWHDYQVSLVQAAVTEYQTFMRAGSDGRAGACTYTPPAPLQGEYPGKDFAGSAIPRWGGCYTHGTSVGSVFGSAPTVPSYDQFVRWGAARANTRLAPGSGLTASTVAALSGGAAAAAAGLVTAGALAALPATQVGNAALLAVAPMLEFTPLSIGGAETASVVFGNVLAGTYAALAAAVTTLVITAVLTVVMRSIQVFGQPDPGQALQAALAKAQGAAVPLTGVVSSGAAGQLLLLFTSSLTGAAYDVGVPDRLPTDPSFRYGTGSQPLRQAVLEDWDGHLQRVEVHSGYFVITGESGRTYVSAQLPVVDGSGRKALAQLVHAPGVPESSGAWRWVLDFVDPDACSSGAPCRPGPLADLRQGGSDSAAISLAANNDPRLTVAVPRPVQERTAATFVLSGTTPDGRLAGLTDVHWTAARSGYPCDPDVFNELDPATLTYRQVQQPSAAAGDAQCSATATGTGGALTFGRSGSWTVTATATDLDSGTQVSTSTTVAVSARQPDVLVAPACTSPGTPAGCAVRRAQEGSPLVVAAQVVGSPGDGPTTLTARAGDRVLATAVFPCVAGAGGIFPTCAPGFSYDLEGVLQVHETGRISARWQLQSGEPYTGPITLTATTAGGGAPGVIASLGPAAGWDDLPPVIGLVVRPGPLPAYSAISVSGTVSDAGGTDAIFSRAFYDGKLSTPPVVVKRADGSFGFTWTGRAAPAADNRTRTTSLFLAFYDPQGQVVTATYPITVTPWEDGTPPVVTPTVVGTQGDGGWYTGDVTVSWAVGDPETAVDATSGCATTTLTTDNPGVTYTCTATGPAGTTTRSVTIKRDATAPVVVVDGGPADGAGYDSTAEGAVPATPTCVASDATSGLTADCTVAGYSAEPGTHVLTFPVTDQAGNAAPDRITYAVSPGGEPPVVTGPTITPVPTGTRGRNGWFTSREVTLAWAVADTSGPVTSSTGCGTVTVRNDTAGQTFTCTATTAAGTNSRSYLLKKASRAPYAYPIGGPDLRQRYPVSAVPGPPTCQVLTGAAPLAGPCEVTGFSRVPGDNAYRLTVTDEAGTTFTDVYAYSVYDDTPPVVTPHVRGQDATWATGDVQVGWSVDEPDSLDTATAGCDPVTVTDDTGPDGLVLTCTATSGGGTTTSPVTVRRDSTGPALVLAGGPEAGRTYRPAELPDLPTCTVTDEGSGAAGDCTLAGFSRDEGAHVLTATGRDVAGNVTTTTVAYAVTSDTTGPVVTPVVSGPSQGGWSTGDSSVSWQVTDPESDVLSTTGCDAVPVPGDTSGSAYSCTATSRGGSTTASVTVRRDTVPPVVTRLSGPAELGVYSPSSLPAATCTATDGGSGVDLAGCAVSGESTEPGSHVLTLTARDVAGNVGSSTVTYTVDDTAPDVTPAVVGPQGHDGWYVGDVTVAFAARDEQSQVTAGAGCAPPPLTTDTAGTTFTCTETSAGGSTTATATVRRDGTPPQVTITGGPAQGAGYSGPLAVPAAPGCTATDKVSGVDAAGCLVTGYSTAVGEHVLLFTARDRAGNTWQQPRPYTVTAVPAAAPAGLTATPGDRSVRLTWSPPATGPAASGYRIQATTPGRAAVVTTTKKTTLTLSGLVAGATYKVRVTATYASGRSPAAVASVVPGRAPALTGTPPGATAGSAYSYAFAVAGTPAATVTLVSGTLPPGLSLSPAGLLGGTPTRSGRWAVTLRAANGIAPAATLSRTIVVAPGAPRAVLPLSGGGQSAAPGGAFGTPLRAAVVDAYGNVVPGVRVSFAVPEVATFGRAAITVTTGPDGTATAPVLTALAAAGTTVATGVRAAVTLGPGLTVTATDGPGVQLARGAVQVAARDLAPGATASFAVTVVVSGPQALSGAVASVSSATAERAPADNTASYLLAVNRT